MSKTAKKVPEIMGDDIRFCAGCGEAIFNRILGEVLTEMDIIGDTIMCSDIGCNHQFQFYMKVDTIVPPHGKMGAALTAQKKVRPDKYALAICGDGGAYAIGLAETMSAATRNENVCMFVMNNTFYAMTGGQMAPTTRPGQVTASTPYGRNAEDHGETFNVMDVMRNLNIAYLARTSVGGPGEVAKTKKMVRKAIEKQRDHKGFSLVEVLVPCPSNWGCSPVEGIRRVKEELIPNYEMGEVIDK